MNKNIILLSTMFISIHSVFPQDNESFQKAMNEQDFQEYTRILTQFTKCDQFAKEQSQHYPNSENRLRKSCYKKVKKQSIDNNHQLHERAKNFLMRIIQYQVVLPLFEEEMNFCNSCNNLSENDENKDSKKVGLSRKKCLKGLKKSSEKGTSLGFLANAITRDYLVGLVDKELEELFNNQENK